MSCCIRASAESARSRPARGRTGRRRARGPARRGRGRPACAWRTPRRSGTAACRTARAARTARRTRLRSSTRLADRDRPTACARATPRRSWSARWPREWSISGAPTPPSRTWRRRSFESSSLSSANSMTRRAAGDGVARSLPRICRGSTARPDPGRLNWRRPRASACRSTSSLIQSRSSDHVRTRRSRVERLASKTPANAGCVLRSFRSASVRSTMGRPSCRCTSSAVK